MGGDSPRYIATAQELAKPMMDRFWAIRGISAETLEQIGLALIDAVHEGMAAGETLAAGDNTAGGLEHYTLGYINGIQDTSGFNGKQGDE